MNRPTLCFVSHCHGPQVHYQLSDWGLRKMRQSDGPVRSVKVSLRLANLGQFRYLLLLLLFVITCPAIAQKIDDTIYSDIVKLRNQGVEKIVRFDSWVFPGPSTVIDTLIGLGIVHPFDIQYLLYKSGGHILSRKYEEYCDINCENIGLAISVDYETSDDSAFIWLQLNETTIKQEQLYPYIYRFKSNGHTHYTKTQIDHPELYLIRIYTAGEDVVKQFDGMGLERQRPGLSSNLNYQANHKTKLFVFFTLLNNYFTRIDNHFVFTASKD